MNKYIKNILFTFAVMFFSLLSVNLAYGAEAKITVGTGSVVEGEQVAIKVQIAADSTIVAGDIWLSYDPSIVTYKSGADIEGDGGLIRFIIDSDGTQTTIEREIVFVGKKAGSCEITATSSCEVVDFESLKLMKVTTLAGKVTVTTPTVASNDNKLKSLVVYGVDKNKKSHKLSLTPSFGAEKTEYNLNVEGDITQLSITATPNDSKATVKVSGLKLSEGDNITTIKVTAENGDSKTYYIYTEKDKLKEEPTTEKPTDKDEKPPVEEIEYIEVLIGEQTMFIPVNPKDIKLPEGFEEVEYTYKEKNIQAAKGLSKNILIVYIVDENKENGSFYIYDEASDKFYPMVNIQTGEKMYTIVATPADFVKPEGFVDTIAKINGKETAAWTYGELSDFIYVYAMNWDGNCAIYCYDTVEKTLQRMSEYTGNSSLSAELDEVKKENENNIDKIEQLEKEKAELQQFKKVIIIVIIVIIVLLLGMIVLNIIALRKNKDDNDPDDNNKSETAATKEVTATKEETATKEVAVTREKLKKVSEPVISADEAVSKENLVPEGGEALVAGLFEADETVNPEKMIPDEAQQSQQEVPDEDKTDVGDAIEAEMIMISKMADDEIDELTAGLDMTVKSDTSETKKYQEKADTTEDMIDRLLDMDF